ncbi:MAG TPA: nickel pincer cofactor biosynthesis protein LarC [Planctomycetaceae bacterium]|nr:nickel pincer cofactor biosynthesis protein LarC [Planctomycetaceae bacterium]
MKIAYLDCACGIAGDMTLAALIDAGVDLQAIRAGIDSLGLDGVRLEVRQVMRGGFRGLHVQVVHPEQHAHRHLGDIREIVARGALSPRQRDLALRLFEAIATAEAKVHGSTLDRVHFHEVGAIDSIVDIVGGAIAWDLLGVDQVVSSPVPTGRGSVLIDHGVCPIPTPGTAELLKGMPLVDVPIDAELTTPTGAAILATMVDRFGPLPAMRLESIGYGAGTKDFPGRGNLLRILVGDAPPSSETDQVALLETNLDDISGEVIGYTKQKLLSAGALDVFSTPIQMKKDRPGVLLSVLCQPSDVTRLEEILFRETGTFGVRRSMLERSKRSRQPYEVTTVWGTIVGKLGWRGGEAMVFVPEFESCAAAAARHGVPLRDVYRAAEAAYQQHPAPSVIAANHAHDHDHGEPHHHHDHDHHDHDHGHDHDHSHDHPHDHHHDH